MTRESRKVTGFARGYTGPDDPRFERDSRLLGQEIQKLRDALESAQASVDNETLRATILAVLEERDAATAESAATATDTPDDFAAVGDSGGEGRSLSPATASPPTPTGTGFRHVTNGVEDPAAKLVELDDIKDGQVAFIKMQSIQNNRLLGRATTLGQIQELSLGTTLGFTGATLAVPDDTITNAKLRNSAACSVIGRQANSTGDPADISTSTQGHVLRRSATQLEFGFLTASDLPAHAHAGGDITGGVVGVQFGGTGANMSATGGTGHVVKQASAGAAFTTGQVQSADIGTSQVTLGKIQDIAPGQILANPLGGAGPPVETNVGSSLAFNLGSIVRAALSGDVTAALNSNTTTIAANAVTTTKINNGAVTKAKIEDAAAQGSTLMRVSSGAGAFEDVPIAGASMPTAFEGMARYRTDDDELYVYEATRGKWLSVSDIQMAFTNQATVAGGSFLRLWQSPVGTATLGFRLPFLCTLVAASGSKNNTSTQADLEVLRDGSVVHTFTIGASAETAAATNIDVDFAGNTVVSVRVNASSSLTSGGALWLLFRRKQT